MDPEHNKLFPPPPVPAMPSQFFPLPQSSQFTTGFPPPGFHVPPPNVPFTPGVPPPGFHVSPSNVSMSSFSSSDFYIPPFKAPSLTAKNWNILDTSNIEKIIIQRRNQVADQETEIDNSQIKIYKFSQLIREFDRSLENMKKMLVDMKSCHDDVTKNDLRKKIEAEKVHVSEIKESIDFYLTNIRILKAKISKRKRKRRKKFNHSSGLTPHQIATEHVLHLQRIATNIEQDEKLKKDADRILSDVLRKKNEAENRLQLLNKLEKLHSARCISRGVDARNSGIVHVIGKLKTMWETQLKEYAVEENGFRLMLEELAVDRKKKSNQKEDKIAKEWLKTIFGVSDLQAFLSYSNVDEFIGIRLNWDKYIVEDCDINLRIPVGWILPQDRCDNAWKKYIYR